MEDKVQSAVVKLTEFVEGLNKLGGVAKPSQFVVEIATPAALSDMSSARYLSLLCAQANLPGIAVGTDDRYLPHGYGVVQKMPWGVLFTDVNLNFYSDGKGLINSIFTKWIDSIVLYNVENDGISDAGHTFFVNYRNKYATDIIIRTYDERRQSIIEYTLFDAYPTLMSDSSLSWAARNEAAMINVKIVFTRWTVKYYKLPSDSGKEISNIKSGLIDYLSSDRSSSQSQSILDSLNDRLRSSVGRSMDNIGARFIENVQQAIPLISGSIGDLRI